MLHSVNIGIPFAISLVLLIFRRVKVDWNHH